MGKLILSGLLVTDKTPAVDIHCEYADLLILTSGQCRLLYEQTHAAISGL